MIKRIKIGTQIDEDLIFAVYSRVRGKQRLYLAIEEALRIWLRHTPRSSPINELSSSDRKKIEELLRAYNAGDKAASKFLNDLSKLSKAANWNDLYPPTAGHSPQTQENESTHNTPSLT